MPRKTFTESQIVAILREAEGELTVDEICRKRLHREEYPLPLEEALRQPRC